MRYSLDTQVPRVIKDYSKPVAKDFLEYLVETGRVTSYTNKRLQLANIAVSVFIHNCYLHAVSNKKKLPVPLSPEVYTKGFILNGRVDKNKVSYTYTRHLIDYMQDHYKGTYELGKREYENHVVGISRKTVVRDTVTIFHMMEDFYRELRSLKESVGFLPKRNVISLRDKNKNPVSFRPSSYQAYMHKVLNKINTEALKVPIGKRTDEDFDTRMQLEKIWNESKERNGKMYTNELQGMPKHERQLLTLRDEPVVCLDYKAFETSLLYTVVGETLSGDPYQIEMEGYDPKILRKVGKMVMTRIYYADNVHQLSSSINFDIADDFDLEDLQNKGAIPDKRIPVNLIVKALMKKHDCVSDYFYKGGDYDPANLGSLVIDYVVEYLNQNFGEIVIPVYDEIICRQSLKDVTLKAMTDGFEHVVGSSKNCVIEEE